MAALPIVFFTPSLALTGTSVAITLLQAVAATNQKIKINEISISFQGTSNTASPVLVDVIEQTTAGTGLTANNPTKFDKTLPEAVQSTGQRGIAQSVEPTAGNVLWEEYIHPQTGLLWQSPFSKEFIVGGGNRLGVRANANAAVNCIARAIGEE
jgi:hypothetical protein